MLSGLRGLAQAFVRGAVAVGRKAAEAYEMLKEGGLGYVEEQFNIDWALYDEQKAFVELAMEMGKDQLISGHLHGDSPQNLTAKFKYDMKAVYEDLKGNTATQFWSVINNERMTQDEIMEYANMFAIDSNPGDEFIVHGQPELVGIWARAVAVV